MEASLHLAEPHFSQIVHSSECVSLASQINVLGGIIKHFQDAHPCSMCVSGSQNKSVKWVPWDLPASRPNFWFLTPVRLPMDMTAQTVGISNGHLHGVSGIQPLGNGFRSHPHRQKVWFTSPPLEHHFLLSDSPAVLYYLAGAIRVGQGGLSVCPRWLVPPSVPTRLLQTVWGAEAAVSPGSLLSAQQPDPALCLLPAFHWGDTEIGKKLHKVVKAKKSSAQEEWTPVLV